jgi:hypothetical protein
VLLTVDFESVAWYMRATLDDAVFLAVEDGNACDAVEAIMAGTYEGAAFSGNVSDWDSPYTGELEVDLEPGTPGDGSVDFSVQFYSLDSSGSGEGTPALRGSFDFTPTVTPGGWAYATVDVGHDADEFSTLVLDASGTFEACHCSDLEDFHMPEGDIPPPE